jgi:hypothetical protein
MRFEIKWHWHNWQFRRGWTWKIDEKTEFWKWFYIGPLYIEFLTKDETLLWK